MTAPIPNKRILKGQARRLMNTRGCLPVTLVIVGVQLIFFGLRNVLGAALGYYMLDLASYGDTTSGIYQTADGVSLILRMDIAQTVLAIPVTYTQFRMFCIVTVVFFIVMAPLRLGVHEQYWNITRKQPCSIAGILPWFTDPRRLGKALAVEFVLEGAIHAVGILTLLPSMYLYVRLYSTATSPENWTAASTGLQVSALLLFILALLFTFWLHSLLLPVRYCLAAHPEFGLGEAFRRGVQSLHGFRARFFLFRLSFLIWFAASEITYSAADLYVLPFTALSGMVFLQEAARGRAYAERAAEQNGSLPPEPPMGAV